MPTKVINWESLKNDIAAIGALVALLLSAISFYWSYFYTKHDLEVTVTSVSFNTNLGELYMTVAFSNDGNRDAAMLRVEPALWSQRKGQKTAEWAALDTRVAKDVPLTDPKVPMTVKAPLEGSNQRARACPESAARFTATSPRWGCGT